MEVDKNYSLDKYPVLQTFLAFLAAATMSVLANIENYQELGVNYIAFNAVAIGLAMIVLLKIFAIPCALLVKIQSGLTYKYSYFKTLKLVYFIPYGILLVGLLLFTAHWLIN